MKFYYGEGLDLLFVVENRLLKFDFLGNSQDGPNFAERVF